MEQFTSEGLVFDVTDAGPADGEVIILLHGYPETRASWQAVIPQLTEAGFRVLAPDQRGYSAGARPQGRRAYRLDHLAGDVVALANAAGAQLPKLPEMGLSGPLERRFRQTLSRSGLPDAHLDQYLSVLQEPGAATAVINWYRALPLMPPSRMVAADVPVVYMYGTEDFALGRKAADLTGRYVKGPYRYKVIEGASHWLPEAHPDVVAQEVIAHARRFGAAAG